MDIYLNDLISENYDEILNDILDHNHTHYIFKGGRGSCKSSFISIAIILLMIQPENKDKHCVIFRKTANTLRDSVYSQMQFAITSLGLDKYFTYTVSPMKITFIKTGQTIIFRGVDDKMKLKSLKAPFGYFGISWLEECDTFSGMEEIRSILQSSMRGGNKFWCFMSYNPPQSVSNFMNKESLIQRDDRIVHSSDYRTVPREWLGEQFFHEAEHLKEINYHAYEHEYLGIPNGNGGNVFEYLEIRTITDPFAYIRLAYDHARETIYLLDELYVNKWSNAKTGQWIIDKGYTDYEITCDSAEPKSINDYRDMGIPARGAIKGAGSIEYSFKWLQVRKIVIDQTRTPNAYQEFVNYEYERDKDGNVISGYPDEGNHLVDAVRYSLEKFWSRRGNNA